MLLSALHIYDRILTLGQEVDCIWRRKNTNIVVPALYLSIHTSASVFLVLAALPSSPDRRVCIFLDVYACADRFDLSCRRAFCVQYSASRDMT